MNHDHRDPSQFRKEHSNFDDADEDADEDTETLSPAVRRLVKQYDLDITAIRGSGPSGRIRVGDVMAMLGSRAGSSSALGTGRASASTFAARDAEILGDAREAEISGETPDSQLLAVAEAHAPLASRHASAPAATVFECDIARIAAHRQSARERGVDISLSSYFVTACSAALRAVPEVNAAEGPIHLVVYGAAEERPAATIIRNADELPLEAMNAVLAGGQKERTDTRARFAAAENPHSAAAPDLSRATFAVHDYGASGCVFATPTPLGAGHPASLGIGRVRRRIVLREVNGEEAPRAASLCYLTLTYDPDRVGLERANLYLANLVRLLEHWPAA